MQANSQNFIEELIKFLKSRIDSTPTYEGVTLIGVDDEETDNGFKVKINNKDYSLRLFGSQPWREDGKPFINLRDINRPMGMDSLIQLTIDNSNFIIDKNSFILKQNRGINIEKGKEGLKQESEKLMLDLGFNENKIILQGEFDNPDFELITKSLFKWLRIRAAVKLKLEEKYRNSTVEEEVSVTIPEEVRVLYGYLAKSMSHRKIQKEILGKDAPARGGGFLSMKIVREFDIRDDKKGVLLTTNIETEISNAKGKYLNALHLLKKYYPELSSNKQINTNGQIKEFHMSKNIILYGPPGTGKTYKSIDKAVKIAAPLRYIPDNHKANKIIFDELRKEGQIEFVTFHQNYAYEDFMVGLKPDVDIDQLRFKSHKGMFYEISKKAKENYVASKQGSSLSRSFEDVFNEMVKPVIEQDTPVKIEMASGIFYEITDVTDYSIHFKKPKGDSRHSLSIQTLKELIEGTKFVTSGLAAYYNPLAEDIKELMKPVEGTKAEQLKNYVLIIDEINRANISKVFGELITLLEDDKRLGEENELKITLPNGEKDFGVPPNIYIIGTMNTADKSIALIDIALRRRFEFIGYYPMYEGYEEDAITLLQQINKAIFEKKKSADYLIGHAYFMKNQTIQMVLQNKVVPLLMEYFSGKTEIISSIFEGTDWAVTYDTNTYSWDILNAAHGSTI